MDDRTDVYSLGVMLYQMLAGYPPFSGAGAGEIMAMHMFSAPRPVQQAEPAVPPEMARLVNLMLAKSPQTRPAMAQVAADLARLAGTVTPGRCHIRRGRRGRVRPPRWGRGPDRGPAPRAGRPSPSSSPRWSWPAVARACT